jgi:hypothetical protein
VWFTVPMTETEQSHHGTCPHCGACAEYVVCDQCDGEPGRHQPSCGACGWGLDAVTVLATSRRAV